MLKLKAADRITEYEVIDGGEAIAENSVSGLASLDDTQLKDGISVDIANLRDSVVLDKASTLAVDGELVFATRSTRGRWVRSCKPNAAWRMVTDWWVKPDSGSNVAAGTSLSTPLRSVDEVMRRIGHTIKGGHGGTTIIHLVPNAANEIAGNISIEVESGNWPEVLEFRGEMTELYSGSITGYQAWNDGAKQEPQITDAAIPVSWTASGLQNGLIVMTSGAISGYTAPVIADLGAKTVSIPKFYSYDFEVVGEPAIGNTFKVYSLPKIVGNVRIRSNGAVWFHRLDMVDAGTFNFLYTDCAQFVFYSSRADATHMEDQGSDLWFSGSLLYGAGVTDCFSSLLNLYGSGMRGGTLELHGALMSIMEGCVLRSATSNGLIRVNHGSCLEIDSIFAAIANTVGPVIRVESGGTCRVLANAWGTGNASAAPVVVRSGGTLIHNGVNVLAIDGAAGSDTLIGGTAKTFAEAAAGFINATNHAKSVIDA